jgi:hypothetical protein
MTDATNPINAEYANKVLLSVKHHLVIHIQRMLTAETVPERSAFVEFTDETVQVHDVLHERVADNWQMRLSSYPKLRLAPERVMKALTSHGLSVRREVGLSGMVRVLARL